MLVNKQFTKKNIFETFYCPTIKVNLATTFLFLFLQVLRVVLNEGLELADVLVVSGSRRGCFPYNVLEGLLNLKKKTLNIMIPL